MSEYVDFLRNLAEMLKSFGKVIDELGEKVDEFADLQIKPKPEKDVKPEPAPELEAKPVEKAAEPEVEAEEAPPKEKAASATETVLNLIQKSRKGISVSSIKKKTGFDGRKVSNIVYSLKKSGRIKSEKKGVYKKA